MTPYDLVIRRLDGARLYRSSAPHIARAHRAYCPAHQPPPHTAERGRTLSIALTTAGRVLLHCHAGCAAADVLAAVGLTLRDLYPALPPNVHRGPLYSGPSAWSSAAAAADALAEAAGRLLTHSDPGAIMEVWTAADAFRRLARAAMRLNGGKR